MHAAAPVALLPARVTRSWAESSTLRGLAFVASITEARPAIPGQFVEVSPAPGLLGHFALASEPGSPELELLFKRGGKVADVLAQLAPGDELSASAPAGSGFPVGEHEGQDLILVAAGSGIAPLRAVIRSLLPTRARFGRVVLFYGQRTPSEFAYVAESAEWAQRDVEIVRVVSDRTQAWEGSRGRVQDAVRTAELPAHDAVAYLCGMRPMIVEVSRVLVDKGLAERRIFLNH